MAPEEKRRLGFSALKASVIGRGIALRHGFRPKLLAHPVLEGARERTEEEQRELDGRLLNAAVSGDIDDLAKALSCGANVNARGENNRTPLMEACRNGHYEIAEYLIERKADITLWDEDLKNAQRHAYDNGHESIVELLALAAEEELERRSTPPPPPLARTGITTIPIELENIGDRMRLTEACTVELVKDASGYRTLKIHHNSSGCSQKAAAASDIIQIITDEGCEVEIENKKFGKWEAKVSMPPGEKETRDAIYEDMETQFTRSNRFPHFGGPPYNLGGHAAESKSSKWVYSLGLGYYAVNGSVTMPLPIHEDAWEEAARSGEGGTGIRIFRYLNRRPQQLDDGEFAMKLSSENPVYQREFGLKPRDEKAIVLNGGIIAKFNSDRNGITIESAWTSALTNRMAEDLHRAIESDDINKVEKLLEWGVSIEARSMHGHSPLNAAVILNNKRMVNRFVRSHNADLDAIDGTGKTALISAIEDGNREMAKHLIELGADPRKPGRTGITPLQSAIRKGDKEIAKLLRQKGAEKPWEIKIKTEKEGDLTDITPHCEVEVLKLNGKKMQLVLRHKSSCSYQTVIIDKLTKGASGSIVTDDGRALVFANEDSGIIAEVAALPTFHSTRGKQRERGFKQKQNSSDVEVVHGIFFPAEPSIVQRCRKIEKVFPSNGEWELELGEGFVLKEVPRERLNEEDTDTMATLYTIESSMVPTYKRHFGFRVTDESGERKRITLGENIRLTIISTMEGTQVTVEYPNEKPEKKKPVQVKPREPEPEDEAKEEEPVRSKKPTLIGFRIHPRSDEKEAAPVKEGPEERPETEAETSVQEDEVDGKKVQIRNGVGEVTQLTGWCAAKVVEQGGKKSLKLLHLKTQTHQIINGEGQTEVLCTTDDGSLLEMSRSADGEWEARVYPPTESITSESVKTGQVFDSKVFAHGRKKPWIWEVGPGYYLVSKRSPKNASDSAELHFYKIPRQNGPGDAEAVERLRSERGRPWEYERAIELEIGKEKVLVFEGALALRLKCNNYGVTVEVCDAPASNL